MQTLPYLPHPADTYLLLIQPIGGKARVEYYMRTDVLPSQSPAILFEGGRVEAKKFLAGKSKEIAWESVPQFNQRKGRKGHLPKPEQIYAG